MKTITPYTTDEANIALATVIRAIRDELLDGESVWIPAFGTFYWRFRKGRVIPGNLLNRPNGPIQLKNRVQPDSYYLKWKTAPLFKESFKDIKPKNPKQPVHSAYARKNRAAKMETAT